MTKSSDDFEAVRRVIEALEPFDPGERERIIRWAAEKLGMMPPSFASTRVDAPPFVQQPSVPVPGFPAAAKDIKSFVVQKNPRSDNQMAAVVAYFHHFEAPPGERKESIGKEDLIDACRKSDRKRPKRPEQVLVNTYHAGLLDKAGTAGQYRLNSVGENLVAMVLPEQRASSTVSHRKTTQKKGGDKKTAKPKSKSKSK